MIANPATFKQAGGGKVYTRVGESDSNVTSKTITLTFDEPVDGFYYYGMGWLRAKNANTETGVFGPINGRYFVTYREYYSATMAGSTSITVTWASDKKSVTIYTRDTGFVSIIDHLGSTYYYIGIPEGAAS